jgi:hypothetical protein
MKIFCAWCGVLIGNQEGTMFLASHGICQRCAALEMAKIKLTKAEPCGEKANSESPKKITDEGASAGNHPTSRRKWI